MRRRPTISSRLEPLEGRTLPSAGGGVWPINIDNPATTLLVRFADGGSPAARGLLNEFQAVVVRSYPDGPEQIALGQGIDPIAALRTLRANPEVVYAQSDGAIRVAKVPNDPRFAQQWALSNPIGPDIAATRAWNVATGTSSTIVAVVDTGVDIAHADLAANIWTNPNPNQGGYVGDLHGWNFINGTPDVTDTNGHGTHIAGIIAAAGNNGIGVSGVDWNARIMPLKTIDGAGNGTVDAAVAAVYYAVAHGARVINASWDGPDYDPALNNAIAYANSQGVVFVAAAGNEAANNDIVPAYPADYAQPNLISVAAVDQSGNLASFSNYGAATVGLAAPGVNILSTVPGGYAYYSGTSMAAPFVSGAAALLVGLHPNWSAPQVVQRILSTTTPLPSLAGKTISGGILNVAAALGVSSDGSTYSPPPPPNLTSSAAAASSTAPAPPSGIVPLAAGATGDDVVADLLASDEFWNQNGGNAQGFVNGVYQALLGRSPDPAGAAYWNALLLNGSTRLAIVQAIQAGPEAKWTKIAREFQTDLNRPGSLAYLKTDPGVQALAGLLAQGYRDDDVRALILSSPEFAGRFAYDPGLIVSAWYQDLLGRGASPAEVAGWVSALQSGGVSMLQAVSAIQASPEARATKVALWFQQDLGRRSSLAALKTDPGVVAFSQLL